MQDTRVGFSSHELSLLVHDPVEELYMSVAGQSRMQPFQSDSQDFDLQVEQVNGASVAREQFVEASKVVTNPVDCEMYPVEKGTSTQMPPPFTEWFAWFAAQTVQSKGVGPVQVSQFGAQTIRPIVGVTKKLLITPTCLPKNREPASVEGSLVSVQVPEMFL